MTTVLSYGGGRQTVAICCLIVREILSRPDHIVMADTGRENPMTWAYLAAHVQPMLATVGLKVEIATGYKRVDLHSKKGDLLIPIYTETGKFSAYCSGEWKRDAKHRYLKEQGIDCGEMWLGFALEERKRVARAVASDRQPNWKIRVPLVELMLTTGDCLTLIRNHGIPEPHQSSCWMCPHKRNAEWLVIRDEHSDYWEMACLMDEELRADDIASGGSGVWLHHSRTPLRTADLAVQEKPELVRQCGLGTCFV